MATPEQDIAEQTKILKQILAQLKKGGGTPDDTGGANGIGDVGQASEDVEKLNENLDQTEEKTDQIADNFNELTTSIGDTADAVSGLVSAMAPGFGSFTPASIRDVALEMDALEAELNKVTGTAGKLTPLMYELANANREFGITTAMSQQALASLQNNMTQFSRLSDISKTKVGNLAVQMEKLGISYDQTAQLQDTLVKGMSMSTEAAINTQREIAKVAGSLGVAPERMARDFQAAAPRLAAYGSQAVDVFKKLAAQSKATGIEMSKLLGITEQFDTFEGAAKATAQLNAVLGTTLNSVDLLTASEGERIEMIKRSIAATGQSWDSMGRFERKAIAATLQISDMDEAARLFGTSLGELEDLEDAVDPQVLAQQDLQKMMALSTSMQDQMVAKFEQMAQVLGGPVREVLSDLQRWFSTEGLQQVESFFKTVSEAITNVHQQWTSFTNSFPLMSGIIGTVTKSIITFGILGTAIFATTKGLGALVLGVKGVGGALAAFGKQGKTAADGVGEALEKTAESGANATKSFGQGLSDAIKKVGQAAKANAKGLLALGGAMALIGVGVGAAAFGMAQFVLSFSKLKAEQLGALVAGLVLFTATMVSLGMVMSTVGTAAAPAMLAFGAAFLMIGGAIAAAAAGFSLLTESIAVLWATIMANDTSAFTEMAVGITALAASIGALTISLSMLGLTAIPGLLGLATLVSSLSAISNSMKDMDTSKIEALSDMTLSISQTTSEQYNGLGTAMKNFGTAITSANSAGVTILQQASQLVKEMAAMNAGATQKSAAQTNTTTTTAQAQKPVEVVINIDGEEFVRKVVIPGLDTVYA
jgi:hypothetical protein